MANAIVVLNTSGIIYDMHKAFHSIICISWVDAVAVISNDANNVELELPHRTPYYRWNIVDEYHSIFC